MDEEIVKRFNEVLRPGDMLYHLGDVAFSTFDIAKGFLSRLKTKEIHLILGNHDEPARMKRLPFRSIHQLRSIAPDSSVPVMLCHYALRTWPSKGRGGYNLYGHSHNTLPGEGRQLDVGVDAWDFRPVEWPEIRAKLKDVEFKIYD